MARKTQKTVHLDSALLPFAARRLENEAAPYENLSTYLNALLLWDMMMGIPHEVMADLMSKPERVREKIIEKLTQDQEMPAWLRTRFEEAIARASEEKCENCEHKPKCEGKMV